MADSAAQVPTDDDKKISKVPATGVTKETEPRLEEGKLVAEIVRTSEAADRAEEEKVEAKVKDVISEAKLSQPAPKIPPDVEDSGVKDPQEEADEVIKKGSTINLPITEAEYNKGLKQKFKSKVTAQGVVYGVSGLLGFVTWIGKIIRESHKKAMKVIFKGGSS